MEVLEKVRNIVKSRFNSTFIYSKKYLKGEKKKKINAKGSFECLYASLILFDSIYRKDKNYYPKVFLKKYWKQKQKFSAVKDIEIQCSNSDEEYYDKECINLFLETLKK